MVGKLKEMVNPLAPVGLIVVFVFVWASESHEQNHLGASKRFVGNLEFVEVGRIIRITKERDHVDLQNLVSKLVIFFENVKEGFVVSAGIVLLNSCNKSCIAGTLHGDDGLVAWDVSHRWCCPLVS